MVKSSSNWLKIVQSNNSQSKQISQRLRFQVIYLHIDRYLVQYVKSMANLTLKNDF